jgi:hypothetical protein
MTQKALTDILAKQGGATTRGNRVEIPAAAELTIFAAFADEALVLERVRTVELEGEYVVAHTAKSERFIVLYEDVRAIRFASAQVGAGYAARA